MKQRPHPAHYGRISYRMRVDGGGSLRLSIVGSVTVPKGGIEVQLPLPRPIRGLEVNGSPIHEFGHSGFTCRECPVEAVVKF
jgi:hypothetical protein